MPRPKPTQLDIIRTNELAERLAVLVLARSEFVKDMELPLPRGIGIRHEQHAELGEVTLFGCVTDLLKDPAPGEIKTDALDLSKALDGFVTALAHYSRFDGRPWVPFVAEQPKAPAEHVPSNTRNDGGMLERARRERSRFMDGKWICLFCGETFDTEQLLTQHEGDESHLIATPEHGGIAGQSAGP